MLVLGVLLLAPASSAWSPPVPVPTEWVVTDADGWTHAEWDGLRDRGLEPLRQLSAGEVLVWGAHGDRPAEEAVLRGPEAKTYTVVLEPRLPGPAQHEILDLLGGREVVLAGPGSPLPSSFQVPHASLDLALAAPGVWWVEPVLPTAARNALSASVLQHGQMSGHPGWDVGLDGSGVILGVADSGIELDHGCFRDESAAIGDVGASHRKVVHVNTTIDDGDHPGQDDYRHGTHIAGTLACAMVDGDRTSGTAPAHGARLLFQDVVNESGWSEPSVDWLLAEALAHGAVIHSDSWGDATTAYTLRSAEFDLWHREVPWSLAFIAPGNNPNLFYEPANARNVVSVGGSLRDDSNDLYWSSSHGPSEEGLRGNFIVAPATSVLSAAADGNSSSFNDDMRASTGTSMSTPMAASIAGVIQQMVQEGWVRGDGEENLTIDGVSRTSGFVPSGAMIRALLALSATDLEGGQQGSESVGSAPDPLQGWGRPDLGSLVQYGMADPSPDIWIHDAFRMAEENRSALAGDWLNTSGDRPLEQVSANLWNGSGAAGPFLAHREVASWELALMPDSNLDVLLSFNQRPFGSMSDDLGLLVRRPDGAEFTSDDALEGTEAVRVKAEDLIGFDSVTIEVRAEAVGVGNHTGMLGVDGDRIGFALAARGIQRQDAVPHIPHEDRVEVNAVTKVRALYNQSRDDVELEVPGTVLLNGSLVEPYLSIERDLGSPMDLNLSLAVRGDWRGVSLIESQIQGHAAILMQCVDEGEIWKIEDGVVDIQLQGAHVPVLILPDCAENGPVWVASNLDSRIDEMGFEQMRVDLFELMDFVRNGSDNDRVTGYRVHLDLTDVQMPWWNASGVRDGAPAALQCGFTMYGLPPLPCEIAFSEGYLLSSDSRSAVLGVRFDWLWEGVPTSIELPLMILSPQPLRAVDGAAATASGAVLLSPGEVPDLVRIETTAWVPPGGWPVRISEHGQPDVLVVMEANEVLDHPTVGCGDVWVSMPTHLPPQAFDHAGMMEYEQGNVTLWVVDLSAGEMVADGDQEVMIWQSEGAGSAAFPTADLEQALLVPGPGCGVEVESPSETLPEVAASDRALFMAAGLLLAIVVTLFLAVQRARDEEQVGVPAPFGRTEEE